MEQETMDWLPVVEVDGIDYVVDVGSRQFRPLHEPAEGIGFRSEKGREMRRAIMGRQWLAFVPRELLEGECNELVV